MSDSPKSVSRFRRQMLFAPIGAAGQEKLAQSTIAVIGLGALGSTIAEKLVRSGVGRLILVDRDWVELDNLPRQTLYHQRHASERIEKAVAAKQALLEIDNGVEIQAKVADVTFENIGGLCEGADLILDGTDNFETRMLLNDFCTKYQIPWVHGGCLGADGQVMVIVPNRTACFRCLMPELPSPGIAATCETAGVLGAAVALVANWQVAWAIRLIVEQGWIPENTLLSIDVWNGRVRPMKLDRAKHAATCPACCGTFEFLSGHRFQSATSLCGKNAVQIQPASTGGVDLQALATRLEPDLIQSQSRFLLRFFHDGLEVTLFRDGRAIISGTEEVPVAKRIYSDICGG